MDETEVTGVLAEVVETWIARGSAMSVARDIEPDVCALLISTGYLTVGSGAEGSGVIPTSEALNLTDPFLCEELASAFRWEFHRRFLAYRNAQS